jgi:F0F1-type ATP synthase epsilon subunit
MAKDQSFTLSVMNEKGVLYYGDCEVLFVPAEKEMIAIMAQHTPMIMKLAPGKVVMQGKTGKKDLSEIKSGLVYVAEDQVTVLVDL